MAQQTVVSSLIGCNLSSSDTTALFALGTRVNTTDGGVYQYAEATSTFITGEIVILNPAGTAKTMLTALLASGGNADGLAFGFAQNIINQGEFGWFAIQGRNMYVLCTGTVTAGVGDGVGFSANSGRLQNAPVVAVAHTAFGIFITTSASTATQSVAVATLTWPRAVPTGGS